MQLKDAGQTSTPFGGGDMQAQLVHSNAVVAAKQFNPSVFSQLWLVRNKIAREEDLAGESVFTPVFVQVRAPQFVLLVVPEQLQFAPSPIEGDQAELVSDRVGRIVKQLPETPYVAVGLNFHWLVQTETDDFAAFCRTLFCRQNPLYESFGDKEARFGGYLSKNIFGARLKLDVKPTKVETEEEVGEKLLFAFNFHVDVGKDEPVSEIQKLLSRWSEARDHATEIINSLENWQWR